MEQAKISNLYDLEQTIAKDLFEGATYPWEVLGKISGFIRELGPKLDPERFEQRGEDIWVAKSVNVAPTAFLNGPLIIDEEAEIRHCAFVRGSAIVGRGSVVGNSRCRTTITSGILCSATNPIWERALSPPILSLTERLWW